MPLERLLTRAVRLNRNTKVVGFSKGHTKAGGRKRGSPNRLTRGAREAFELAFQAIGGVKELEAWARANPTEFYKLYARLIPVEHVGDDGEGPIRTVVRHVFETVS
jgi:hypothetical protein